MKNEKMKLNLNDLKVESFVTNISKNDTKTVKGGSTWACSVGSLIFLTIVSLNTNTFTNSVKGGC